MSNVLSTLPMAGNGIVFNSTNTPNMTTSSLPATGGTTNTNWWNPIVSSLPGILGGVAGIIGASEGVAPINNYYTNVPQTSQEKKDKDKFPWAILVIVAVILIVIAMVFLLVKQKK